MHFPRLTLDPKLLSEIIQKCSTYIQHKLVFPIFYSYTDIWQKKLILNPVEWRNLKDTQWGKKLEKKEDMLYNSTYMKVKNLTDLSYGKT